MSDVIAKPLPGMQTLVVTCPCFEVFAGGARGPGKTFSMLLDWLNHQSEYREQAVGLMIRRTYKQLVDTIQEAKKLFLPLGARWVATGVDYGTFFFPTGARIRFRYLSDDKDAEEYQGWSNTRVYVEELGHFPSSTPILKLMATLRARPGVQVGFRATGNPGGPGTSWIKARYITPAPLGMKFISTEYKNPWTGAVITRDRVYIPGNVQENPFLGPDYVANLQMQASPKLVRAWLTGDWSIVEGAFFDNFSTDLHVVRPFTIPGTWMRFRAGDWGSFRPFAFGWFAVVSDSYPIRRDNGQVTVLPRGALVAYREYYGMQPNQFNTGLKLTVEQAADGILARELEEPRGLDGKHGVRDGVLDPACFRHESGPSIAERFAGKRVAWREADNTRVARTGAIAGWDLVRHRLDGEDGRPMLYFFDTCVHGIRTLPELQHDELRPEDVDCWVGETLVATPGGPRRIDGIKAGDVVTTPIGDKRVLRSYVSGVGRTVKVTLADGRILQGTPRHKVMVKGRGLVRLDALCVDDDLTEGGTAWQRRLLSMVVWSTFAMRGEGITILMGRILPMGLPVFIGRSGWMPAGISHHATIFTTSTGTSTTTTYPIWSAYRQRIICGITWKAGTKSLFILGKRPQGGDVFFGKRGSDFKPRHQDVHLRAVIVEILLRLGILRSGIARFNVARLPEASRFLRSVRSVASRFGFVATTPRKFEPARIVAVGSSDDRPVFNLTVADAHLFYANGILSSNTESEDHWGDMLRYACASRPFIKRVPKEEGASLSLADEHGNVVVNIDKMFEEAERRLVRGSRRI